MPSHIIAASVGDKWGASRMFSSVAGAASGSAIVLPSIEPYSRREPLFSRDGPPSRRTPANEDYHCAVGSLTVQLSDLLAGPAKPLREARHGIDRGPS